MSQKSEIPLKQGKSPAVSETTMTELVMPNDANNLDNLMGGVLLRWMDICSAIAAGKHANCVAVTAAVDNVSFKLPIERGQIVTLQAKVTRAFRTSMEVHIEVFKEGLQSQEKVHCNTAYYTFVALGPDHKKIPVPPLIPQSPDEIRQFNQAQNRRELRLILAGRMKPSQATSLQKLFVDLS